MCVLLLLFIIYYHYIAFLHVAAPWCPFLFALPARGPSYELIIWWNFQPKMEVL